MDKVWLENAEQNDGPSQRWDMSPEQVMSTRAGFRSGA